ncbi:MAG: hypothetical protein K2O47_05590 [Muribaculaceae bacterium]|nr:hypothetical protein [Muribaculaceae bacterium]
MRNSLTSKERRGLAAVVAAALLCISSGFIFRNCSSLTSGNQPVSSCESAISSGVVASDSVRSGKSVRKGKPEKKKKSKVKKSKTLKTYPTRDPLSEPCD